MWVVAWEEGYHQHKVEAHSEAAAEAHAHQLVTGKKLARVTYYLDRHGGPMTDTRDLVAQVGELIAQEIEAAFTRWDSLGDGPRAPHPIHSQAWLVERAYAHAAHIARTAATEGHQ